MSRCFAAVAVAWTALVVLSILWNLHQERQEALEEARVQARTAYQKDVLYRRWNAGLGGVYARASEATPPNPQLDVPERDIQTPSGERLTLVNPAYMTRQVHELARATDGVLGHITSLNPIRPENSPDSWESSALRRFADGEKEVSEVGEIGGQLYMRLMRPLTTEGSCLKCHARQGYKVGDIRGGISVAVPLRPLQAGSTRRMLPVVAGLAGLWAVGLLGLTVGVRRLNQRIRDRDRAEQALRENEARHRAIFESATDAMLVYDSSGRIVEANPAAYALYGYEHETLLGLSGKDLIHPDHRLRFDRFMAQLAAGKDFHGEGRDVRRDGTPLDVEIRGTTLQFRGRTHVLSVVRDISERKQAENRMSKLNECFLAFGPEPTENISRLLALCAELLGAHEALYGRLQEDCFVAAALWNAPGVLPGLEGPDRRVCPEAVREGVEDVVALPGAAEAPGVSGTSSDRLSTPRSQVWKAVRRDHETLGAICLSYSADHRPTRDDKRILGIVASAIGIEEERRRSQEQLREGNLRMLAALERERSTSMALEAAMQQLEAATQEANAATRAKSDFLASMSHEIRTPMTAIIGFAESLLDPDLNEAERTAAVHTIRRNGEHLLELINEVLDLSKIEANRLEVEVVSVSVVQFVSELQFLLRPRALAKGLEFAVQYLGPVPEKIETDPTRLRQILINLLGNAFKFTDSGSVRMDISLVNTSSPGSEGTPGFLQFEIIDTGIGILPGQIQRLFQPFSQADPSTARAFGGTGLGLAISKRIAEKLGGNIAVRSTPGIGSAFAVIIPLGPLAGVRMLEDPACSTPDLPAAEAAEDDSVQRLDCRILLAEDGPDNQRLVSMILQKAGAEVALAQNGKVALELAMAASCGRRAGDPKRPFDVILMDIQMPVMDGYEATRRLRERGYAGTIIALTAHAMAADRDRCLQAGCDDFISKPIVRRKLLSTISRHLAPGRRASGASRDPVAEGCGQPVGRASDRPGGDLPARAAAVAQALVEGDFEAFATQVGQLRRLAESSGLTTISEFAAGLQTVAVAQQDLEQLAATVRELTTLCESAAQSSTVNH